MDIIKASASITRFFVGNWVAKTGGTIDNPTIPYTVDNIARMDKDRFVRLQVTDLEERQLTVGNPGNRIFEHSGIIEVRINDILGKGRGRTDELAHFVRQLFRSRRIGRTTTDTGVVTQAVSISELRRDQEAPRYWLVTCTCPFTFRDRA
jgi:hypothetical protein